MRVTPSLDLRDPERGLRLVARETVDPRLVERIEATRFGTAGLRYRYRDMGPHLRGIAHPVFLALERGETVVGTYVLSRKRVHTPLGAAEAWYRGLLTVSDRHRGEGLGRMLVEQAFAWLRVRAAVEGRPVLSYGCIQGDNTRSQSLLDALGARTVGGFSALPVYLHAPREALRVDPLNIGEVPAVVERLRAWTADLGLTDVGHIDPARYFIAPGPRGPVAGASVRVERLVLDDIGGAIDPIVRALARAPFLRDRLDLGDLRWLKLHDLLVDPAHVDVWPDFVAALCARHGVNVAVFVLDRDGPTYAALDQGGVFGVASVLFDTPIGVSVVAFGDGGDDWVDAIDGRPVCLSPDP